MKRLTLLSFAVATSVVFAQDPAAPAPTTPASPPIATETKPAEPVAPPTEVLPVVEIAPVTETTPAVTPATTPAVVTVPPGESEPPVPRVAETGGPRGKKQGNFGKKAGKKRRGKKR